MATDQTKFRPPKYVDPQSGKSFNSLSGNSGQSQEAAIAIEPKMTPVPDSMLNRVISGVSYILTGQGPGANFFSPGNPIAPVAQDIGTRQFDYQTAQNINYTPRANYDISFSMLRSLADSYDILRMVIESRKDEIVALTWNFNLKDSDDPSSAEDPRINELKEFFRFPDKINTWDTWLRMLLEDLFVIDAATIYPIMQNDGKPFAFEPVDGSTITPVIDVDGRQPSGTNPAFQQIIKGVPAKDFNSDEMVYAPRNKRVNRIYGYSPVEQIIVTVNIALRKQMAQLQYYTEGNVPEMLIEVPPTWQNDQISTFQQAFDALLAGNTAQRSRAKFIPGGGKITQTKDALLKDDFDEWLARICCYALSVSAQPFIKQMSRATAVTAQEVAEDQGLIPIKNWIKNLMDRLVQKYFGYDDIEFSWESASVHDILEQAQADDIYIRNGTYSVDEVRARQGLPAIGMPNAVYTMSGAVLIKDVLNPPDPVALPSAAVPPKGEPTQKLLFSDSIKKKRLY